MRFFVAGLAPGLAVALASGIGCYSSSAAELVPCSDAGRCPEGQFCRADGLCSSRADAVADAGSDGPIGDAGATDSAVDAGTCVTNDRTHDEDHDGTPDLTDGCPIMANGPDPDGDAIRGVCDASNAAADTVASQESFECGIPANWQTEHATSIADGIELDGTLGRAIANTHEPFDNNYNMLVSVTLAASPIADARFQLSAVAGATSVAFCDLHPPVNASGSLVVYSDPSQSDAMTAAFTSPDRSFIVRFRHSGSNYTCAVFAADGATQLATASVTKASNTVPTLLIAVESLTAQLGAWVEVRQKN